MDTQKKRYGNITKTTRMVNIRLPHELKTELDKFLTASPGRKRQTQFVISAIRAELARQTNVMG